MAMAVPVTDGSPVGRSNSRRVRRPSVSRVMLGAVSGGLGALLPFAGWTGVPLAGAFLLLTVALAAALAPGPASGRLSVVGWLPFSFVLLVSAVAGVGALAGLIHIATWGSRPAALLLWSTLTISVVALAAKRGGRVALVAQDFESAVAGGGLLAGGILLSLLNPFEVWGRNVSLGTDFARHLVITKDVAEAGALTYSSGAVYPKGLHALYATVWQASGTSSFESTWLGLQALTWLMLCLMVMALVSCAARACRALALPTWLSWLTGGLVVVAFVQSMWLSAMMARGFVTSVLAGLVVAVAVSVPFDGKWIGSARAVMVSAVLVAAAAHAWQVVAVLPAVLCFAALVAWWRNRSAPVATGIVLLLCAAAAALPSVYGLASVADESGSYAGQIVMPAGSGLWLPEPWWWLGVVLTIATVGLLWRGGRRGAAGAWALLLATGAAAILALAWRTGTDWTSPGYYVLKTLWTMSNLVLPGAFAGAIVLLYRAASWGAQRGPGIVRVATTVGVAAVVIAGGAVALGRMTATSDVGNAIRGGYGSIPFNLVALRHLEQVGVRFPAQRAVTFGIVPSAKNDVVSIGAAGANDQLVQESLRWVDRDVTGPSYSVLIRRDAPAVCEWLRANPDAVLVTGPNAAAGMDWLLRSGCPGSVLKRRVIAEVRMTDEWFAGVPDAGRPFTYPTWAQFQAEREGAARDS